MGFGVWGAGGMKKRLYRGGSKEKKILVLKMGGHQKIPLSDGIGINAKGREGKHAFKGSMPLDPILYYAPKGNSTPLKSIKAYQIEHFVRKNNKLSQ